jgi:hypothetical protein
LIRGEGNHRRNHRTPDALDTLESPGKVILGRFSCHVTKRRRRTFSTSWPPPPPSCTMSGRCEDLQSHRVMRDLQRATLYHASDWRAGALFPSSTSTKRFLVFMFRYPNFFLSFDSLVLDLDEAYGQLDQDGFFLLSLHVCTNIVLVC